MLTCKEASTAIAADRLEEAGWWYRLQARLHLSMCRHCRRYAAQIGAIGDAARSLCAETDAAELAKLEQLVLHSVPEAGGEVASRGE